MHKPCQRGYPCWLCCLEEKFRFDKQLNKFWSQNSSVSIVTRLRLVQPEFNSCKGNDGIFLFATMSKQALGPNHPPNERVPGALTPSSSEVMNAWNYTSTPTICIHGVMFN
jgi:hypothetical protein